MEVEVDLASIRDEELLRRMWQQSEDFGRKKDIRQHIYKLREARLREFYTIGTDIMDCPTGQGINIKSPLTPSHGDSLADQSFQSFKTKEIRDSESPTKDMKFAQQQLHTVRDGSICVKPDTSGWNVVTSSEVNPDGKGYKTETLATTEGIRKIAGGQTEFAGKNEHMQKASHHGDDQNFVNTAAESSNTHLQESSVVGDEKSGRIEKKSSTTVSSSSKSFVSKSTTGGDDGGYDDNYLDSHNNAISNRRDSTQSNMSVNSNMSNQQQQQRQLTLQEKLQQTRKNIESQSTTSVREEEHHHEQHQRQHEQRQYQEEVEQQNIRRQQHQDERIIREQQHHQQQHQNSAISKDAQRYMTKYTDKEGVTYKKSPVINQDSPAELQREFQRLETQPGRIISRTVEYPKPNLKMIVEKKELADGTIITSRNYETEGTPTVTETQKKVVSGSRKVEEGGSYKISITKGSTDDDQHQFTKNVDQRSRQILRDTDRKLTNTNERNITNRTITSDERENIEREFQQNRINVTEEMINQDHINQTRQIARDREEFMKKFNHIDVNKDKQRYEREFQEWRNTNRDTVDRGIVTNIARDTARDHLENLKDQIETFDIHKTVKKDLSQTMRKENMSSQDFIQTEDGCVMIDRNNISGRPEKIISAPTNQYDDCYEHTESHTSTKETYNNKVHESEDDYHPRGQKPGKQQRPEQDFSTHGFPSQRLDNDSKDIYTTNEQYENRTERIRKTEDFSTQGFPSVRDPTPKKPFDHSPTQSTGRQPTPEFTSPGRTHKDDKPDFTTHGFPSARAPTEKKTVDHGPLRSPHDKKPQQGYSTHGFPSVRDSTPKIPTDHGPVRSPNSKHPNQDFSTHGFPSIGSPNNKKQPDHDYPTNKSPHGERPAQDFSTKNGFPSAREPTSTKRIDENITEVKKTNQYQTKAQQKTTERKTEMYTSTESLRKEKKTDAAHDAFARSLRCASPVDMPRRDSNASQKSTSYRTQSIQTSRGSTPTYRAPTTTSKLKTREVHQSNETIDLGSPHHHVDDLKRRGTSKVTTTTTTTKARDSSGEIQKKKISPLNRQNKVPVYEPKITKKTIVEDDRFVGAEEIIEEPIVKTNYKQLCPDSCPLPKRFDEITEITKNISSENYGAKRFAKSPTRNYMEPTESQINRVSKNFEEEHLRTNLTSIEPESETESKKFVFLNLETIPTREKSIPRNKSPIRDNSIPQKSIPKQHYLEPTESQISRVSKNIETYMEGAQSVPNQRASSPNRKSSPTRETSPNRKASPSRSSTISNKSIEKTQSSEEYNNQHQNYSKPHTILGPVPINPVGYVSKKVSSQITTNTDFKEIDDSKVTYPGFLKKSKSKSPKGSPRASPERTNSRKKSPEPNDKLSYSTKNQPYDSPVSNRKPSGPISQREPYHVPQYDSPKSKPTSVHPQSTSPDRKTITRDNLTSTTSKINKVDNTVTCEDTMYDNNDSSKPSRPQQPHYASPISKPSSRHPQSTSPERTIISRDDLRTQTTKTSREDTTYDYEDSYEPSGPRKPNYASPTSKPTSKYPKSISPERTTFTRENLKTKTTKTNKLNTTATEDTPHEYEDITKPSGPQKQRYSSPSSNPISKHPKSISPERTTITGDDLRTKITKTNKTDTTVTREDTTYDYEDSCELSSHRQPSYAPNTKKPISPKSTSPERTTRDNLKSTTTKTNKLNITDSSKQTTYDYEDETDISHPKEPYYSSPTSKPASKLHQSTSPDRRTTITRDDLITKTNKINKFNSTVTRDNTTYDYEDDSETLAHQEPHYSTPKSKPTKKHPESASPERTTTSRGDLTTKASITNKFDSTVTREDNTYELEDHSEPSHPEQLHDFRTSKPSSRYDRLSPERSRDDFRTNTTKTVNSSVTREDTTYNTSEPLRPQEPRYASPISKHPQSTSPERTTTKSSKSDRIVTREDTRYGHEDNFGPSCPRELKPTGQKSKPGSKSPQSKSPERTLNTKNDMTQFTGTTSKTTLLNKSKKPSTLDKECHTSDDEGIEPESPRTGSPTSDFEYQRNVDIKSKNITTNLDSENILIEDICKTHKAAVNTEFITNEKENVYRETSPENEKYRPRSTTQEYFQQTEKIENLRYPSSKSPEDNKLKEPFFLRENPEDEKDGPINESTKPKSKAPFNRRETFEQRCRQVLGINETNEINESRSVISKHHNTSDFIENEKTIADIRKVTKSSSPSPVPSPRSSSPKKITLKQGEETNNAHEKFIKHEKTTTTKKQTENNRSVSPGYSPTRKTSPQRVKPTKTIQDESYCTTTTTRQEHYSDSPKYTSSGFPYSRSPASSPVRGPSSRPRSPDKISNTTSKNDSHIESYVTSDKKATTINRQPENQTHISVAKIKISPSTPKSYVPDNNQLKQQKVKSSPINQITTTTSTISSNRNTTKATARKSSPDNSRPNKKLVPLIHKKSDSELDRESDIISDNDDIITTTTTKITKTTKKSTANKKLPVVERKESAPVYRTTHIDRDQKMTRSTSDNLLKTQKRTKPLESDKAQHTSATGPKSPRKSSLDNKKDLKTEKRPIKCLTTKTINLSTKSNIINSEDMENVIIDIQQAKSSREPSPNKMVPVPVSLNEDTGKPRYPDKVQEPEEDRRRSRVKNIPIFEEAKDDFIGCQITEVEENEDEYLRRKHSSKKLFNDTKTTIQNSTEIDRNTTFDEDCLLSVHDKVSKFINTAEEVKKPKPSAPFQRDVPQMNFPQDDDCLLSVNDKVNKFLTTAEKVTNNVITSTGKIIEKVNIDEIDKNLREDECILSVSQKVNKFINTAEKLTETQPQKSPELVARIEKQISRQSDDDRNEEEILNTKTTTVKNRITERYTPDKPKREPIKVSAKPLIKSTDAVRKAKSVFERNELKDVNFTKTTATTKQRDILSRPSVWETQKHETTENRKNFKNRTDTDYYKTPRTTKPVSLSRDLETNSTDRYDNTVITSKTEISTKAEDVTARLTRKTTPRRPSDSQSIRYPDKKNQTVDKRTEYSNEYTNKYSNKKPKEHSPNKSPVMESPMPKHPMESKTEYTDEYTDKYGYTEKNISKKMSSSSITSKRVDQKSPEQSPSRVSRKPAESQSSPTNKKPETYTPSWSRNKQPKQSSPTRLDTHSPTRVTSSYVEENTSYSTSTIKGDHSPTRPSNKLSPTQYSKRPDDHSPARSGNQYTEEHKNYHTSSTRNGAPSPSIQDRKYLFENIEPGTPRPSYMDHTKASLEHIRRDSLEINRSSYNRRVSVDEESFDGNPRSAVKFGVDLKHHDETRPRRKSSSPDIPHVEEIFDLNLLEQMLTVVVGYEQRRRIRSQIRIVKKMIEQRTSEEAQIAYIRETSPARRSASSERENSITREHINNKTEDEQIAYIRETSPARRISPTRSVTSISSQKKNIRTKSSSSFIERESKHTEKHESTRDRSPQSKIRTTTTVTEYRKVGDKPLNKTTSVPLKDSKTDDKPIWATKNILKKPSDNNHSPKSTATKKSNTSTIKTTQSQRQKLSSDEDCITSSYGIGPTDEDGRPLFGIRALKKKQQPSETSKVTGTVITENFYSENGSAPVGERKITVYSSNPNDIDQYESKYDHTKRSGSIKRESSKQNGLTSVTRTQKFGGQYPIEDGDYPALTDDLSSTNTKSSKVIRKGSVKEMSEKFIRKESSSSVTEKTTSTSSTSYPKSGSTLRSQITHHETTPMGQRSYENDGDECDYEYDSSTKHSQIINDSESESEACNVTRTVNKSSKSFLNTSGSKVTGVNDVLDRMRNADNVIEDGDTLEDHEARALLNKFLGATVLMSGVESMVPKEVITRKTIKVEGSPGSTQEVKTTRVTKTIKTEGNSSSPVAQQTCDIEEIWDIEFLKELLEQSTSYEERSKIRARIKQLMAEREACAKIVASVKAELQSSNAKNESSKVESKKIITTKLAKEEEEEEEEEVSEDDCEEGEEEVDGDSSSEYEEIIVEVTDSEDDDDEVEVKETDKKPIVKSVVESKVVPKQPLLSNNKQIIKTTTIIKTDNSNKDNKKEGKNNKNIDEDLSEGGDSLLLPLLQGLLHKNMPPITHNQTTKITANTNSNNNSNYSSNNPKNNNNNNSDSNKLVNNTKKTSQIMSTQIQQKNQININKSISSLTNNNNKKINSGPHPIEDSGTESGEDLRLIAAGLRDTMQMHSIKDASDTGLISEVTTALNRLEQSLKEGKHIKLENSKRNALLNLVGRLQTGLISPDKMPPPTPAPDQTGEMETSSPEADNHRGSNRQRFAKRRSRANRHTVGVSREELADARRYMEEMVMIENMSNCTTPESSAVTPSDLIPQPVKNEQAVEKKPTENSVKQHQPQPQSSALYRPNQFVPNNLKDITAGASHAQDEYDPDNSPPGVQMRGKKPKFEPNQRLSGNYDQQGPTMVSRRPLSDSYTTTLGQQIQNYENVPQQHINVNNELSQFNGQVQNQAQFNSYTNQPNYDSYASHQSTNYSQYGPVFNAVNSFDHPYDGIYENGSPNNVPLNRFSNKKLAMKRANTIDIPKPMKYLHDMESDSDAEERGVSSTKSIGLRGTVQVSVKTKPRQVLPAFQPKTENDIKFLQFIQKQGPSPSLGWNNPNRTVSNWTNKFGNIKNSFESGAIGKPPVPASAAKNFWKKNDSQQSSGGKTSVSKVSKSNKGSGRPPWADQNYSSNVLTSALKTKERNEYPSAIHGHNSNFVQQHVQPHQQQQQHYAQVPYPQPQIPQQHEVLQRQQNSPQMRQLHSPQMRQQHSPQMRQQQSPIQSQYIQSPQNHIPQQQIIKPKPISLNNFSHAPQSVFKPVDPVTPEYPEAFKPIPIDPRLHQSEPHLNYQPDAHLYRDQLTHQENQNKPWSLVGKYSAPSSPHHSIPSPTKAWFSTKNSTPSSPVTSTLPWLSKSKVDNRIRSKAEKFDKRSPPPANLQRHHSLRGKDQDYQNRMSSYDLEKVDHKRPSLPNTSEPHVNGVQSMPFYGSNPKLNYDRQVESQYHQTEHQYQPTAPITKYQQSGPMPKYQQSAAPYQGISQPYNTTEIIQSPLKSDYKTTPYQQTPTQYKLPPEPTYPSIPYTSTDYSEHAISTFTQPRNREESLTNPNAEPLVLTSTKPSYGPTHPLKIFDYPSPSCSISSPNFTQNDATDDDLDPECMTEYKAESKVMTGPVSQQAITVGSKTRHVGNEEKHTNDAKSLLSVMKNLGHSNLSKDKKSNEKTPNLCLSPDGGSYQAPLVESVFPESTGNVQNRMPTYAETKQQVFEPHNTQQLPTFQTQTYNPSFAAVPQTQYQQNPTYVPPVLETQTPTMYTGFPPGYRLPPEINSEVNFKSSQSYHPVSEFNDKHNVPQHHIPPATQNYQYGDLRQNPTYEQPRDQNYQPAIEPQQLPAYNNHTQYPDVQKNLNQHREIHDNYPKQQHEQQKRQQEPIEKPRKKSMSKVDFQDAPRSGYIPENPPKPIVQPKVTYQDLKPVKRQLPENIKTGGPVLPQAYLRPMEVDPQSPKFYQDIQTLSQSVKKPESKLVKKEPAQTQLQKNIQETQHQVVAQQSKLHQTEQKSKVIYEQTKKQIKTSNKVEQKQQQQSEISTKVHSQQKVFQENKMNIKSLEETQKKTTKVFSQASQEIVEKAEYKSSAPADTPDIVKSSLPKDENFPILKKFGPPQRHLYTPNAYKSPLGRSDSHSDVKPVGPIMTRKFSDPSGIAKFIAPEIVETPSTPMPADSKDEIPRNIVFNNVAQFSNMSRRISDTTDTYQKFPVPNSRPNPLSKSDSWNKICQQQNSAKPPSPKFNQSGEFGGHGLRRAKSGHTLALPKMYEAGIKREEITEKQKTVAAYFTGNKSPNSLSRNSSQSNLTETANETSSVSTTTTKRSSINRIRTSEKTSVNKQYPTTGLSRSATMPHILNLLDEKSTTSETTKTKNEDGSVVTTTTKVTTRTVSSGSTTVPKQVSPFAKFKQLDKQNSIPSQNSTKISITPGGANRGAPIFAFTDPTVAARAATAKEQLLHWCQMKTKEYENIQITNFSTSWNDGMAFCALIHHFLPDAFDYTKLTPKQRRYNFTLAFRVADEKAGIAPLLDVEDMVVMKRPDWKCVFTYVQSIHRHFRNCQ